MAGYKSPFAGTVADKANKRKKERKDSDKWFWERWGEKKGAEAADSILDMHKKPKKKK